MVRGETLSLEAVPGLTRAEKKSKQRYPKFAKGEIHYKVFLGKNF